VRGGTRDLLANLFPLRQSPHHSFGRQPGTEGGLAPIRAIFLVGPPVVAISEGAPTPPCRTGHAPTDFRLTLMTLSSSARRFVTRPPMDVGNIPGLCTAFTPPLFTSYPDPFAHDNPNWTTSGRLVERYSRKVRRLARAPIPFCFLTAHPSASFPSEMLARPFSWHLGRHPDVVGHSSDRQSPRSVSFFFRRSFPFPWALTQVRRLFGTTTQGRRQYPQICLRFFLRAHSHPAREAEPIPGRRTAIPQGSEPTPYSLTRCARIVGPLPS